MCSLADGDLVRSADAINSAAAASPHHQRIHQLQQQRQEEDDDGRAMLGSTHGSAGVTNNAADKHAVS